MIKNLKHKKGFTLAEVLAVVAILIILFAIGVPAVFTIQRNLRQTELDAKAETIYVAVQNKLSKMKAADNTDILQKGTPMSGRPSDCSAEEWEEIKSNNPSYFTSKDYTTSTSVAYAVMAGDTVDASLAGYHWVVEYNPKNCTVYAVFYSEDRADCASEYPGSYDSLRVKSARLSDGARVGYYGGGIAGSGDNLIEINPDIEIVNNEKLRAIITCTIPESVEKPAPLFKVEISDAAGNTNTMTYAWTADNDPVALTGSKIKATQSFSGHTYTLELTLDDLTSDATRFAAQYGIYSDNTVKLLSGTDLNIKVTAMCPGNKTVSGNHFDTAKTNSLFDDTTEAGADVTSIKAEIRYGRHLQNLDVLSGVSENVKSAEQIANISFTDQTNVEEFRDWYETYSKASNAYDANNNYFNGLDSNGCPLFKPIYNENLISYIGAKVETDPSTNKEKVTQYSIVNLNVDTSSDATGSINAGLFETIGISKPMTVQNVVLNSSKVVSGYNDKVDLSKSATIRDAGTLAGKIKGTSTVQNITVTGTWVSSTAGAGTSVITNAGGLAGEINGGSTADTVVVTGAGVNSDTYAAGLSGNVSGNASLTKCVVYLTSDDIGTGDDKKDNTYVWISGNIAGGLVGVVSDGTVTVNQCSASTVVGNYVFDSVNNVVSEYKSTCVGGLIGSVMAGSVTVGESYADCYLVGNISGGLVGHSYTSVAIDCCYAAGFMTFSDKDNSAALVSGYASIANSYSVVRGLNLDSDVHLIVTNADADHHVYYMLSADNITVLKATGKFTVPTDARTYQLMEGVPETYIYPVLTALQHYGDYKKGYTLTLKNGTTDKSDICWESLIQDEGVSNLADYTPYTAPTDKNGQWKLVGWYADNTLNSSGDPNGKLILDENGKIIADVGTYDGFKIEYKKDDNGNPVTDENGKNIKVITLSRDVTLYACWTKGGKTDIYVLTNTFSYNGKSTGLDSDVTLDNCNKYLIVDRSVESTEAVVAYSDGANLTTGTAEVKTDGVYSSSPYIIANDTVNTYAWTAVPSEYYLNKTQIPNLPSDWTGNNSAQDYGSAFHLINNKTYLFRNVTAYATNVGNMTVTDALYETGSSGQNWYFENRMFKYSTDNLRGRFGGSDWIKMLYFDSACVLNSANSVPSGYNKAYIYERQTVDATVYTFDIYNTHTLTYKDGNTVLSTVTFPDDKAYTITIADYPANKTDSYGNTLHCDGWSATDGGAIIYTNGQTHDFNEDTVLYAHWSKAYTVTYYTNGGSLPSGTQNPVTVTPNASGNATVNLPRPTKTGFTFAGWSKQGASTVIVPPEDETSAYTDTINQDTAYTAEWNTTVTFDIQGHGTAPSPNPQTVTVGDKVTKPDDLTASGYIFGGWYKDKDCKDADDWDFTKDTVEGPTTLYAKWTYGLSITKTATSTDDAKAVITDGVVTAVTAGSKITYTITVTNETAAEVTGLTVTDTLPENMQFTGISSKDEKNNAGTVKTADNKTTITWTGVSVPAGDNTGATPVPGTVTFTIEVTTNGEISENIDIINTVTLKDAEEKETAATATVKVTPKTYTVTYNANGGSGAPTAQTKTHGVDLTLSSTVPTRTGYTFLGWNTNSSATTVEYAKGAKYTANADVTLYAIWQTTVTFNTQGHGTAPSPNPQTVTVGDKATKPDDLTATGYTFGGWYKEAACTNAWDFSTDTVTTPTTLYAKWSTTVTFNTQGHGTAPAAQTVVVGGKATEPTPAPAASGYTFGGWYKDAACTTGNEWNFDTAITAPTTLYAKWTYGLTITKTADKASVTADGNITYTITVTNSTAAKVDKLTVTDVLPDNMTQKAASTVPTATLSNKTLTWPSFALEANSSTTFTVTYTTAADITTDTEITNTAHLVDANKTDSEATAKVTVNPQKFTVTYNANGGSGAPGNQTKTYGVDLTLSTTVPTRTGYTFQGWDTSSTATTVVYAAGANYIENADVTLYAVWKTTVSFNTLGHGTAPASQDVVVGGHATEPSDKPTAEGYTFVGWYKEAACTNAWNFSTDTVTAPTTLYAKWTTTVTFNTQGHGTTPAAQTVVVGENATEPTPAPTATGYTFGGWYKDASCTTGNEWNFDTAITAPTTLYAKWTYGLTITKTADKASVTAGGNITYTITVTNSTAAKVDKLTVTDILPDNMTQKAVSTDPTATLSGKTLTWPSFALEANSSTTLTVTYTTAADITTDTEITNTAHLVDANKTDSTATATVTVNPQKFTVLWVNDDGTQLEKDENVVYGTTPTYNSTTPTKAQDDQYTYTFKGWTPEISADTKVTADVTYKATYTQTPRVYNINYVLGGGINADSNPATYTYGTGVASFADATRTGYTFDGWFDAQSEGTQITSIDTTQTGDVTLYAHWTANIYNIEYELNNGTNDPNNPSTYTYGVGVTSFNNPTRTGYTFDGWYDSETFDNTITNISTTQTGTVKLWAKWTPVTHKVIFNGNGATNGTMADEEFTYGEPAKALTTNAYTRIGYTFTGWNTKADGSGTAYTDEQQLSNLTEDITLYAQWAPITYTIRYNKNNTSATGTMADQTVTFDTHPNLTENSYELNGYEFKGWATSAGSTTVVYADKYTINPDLTTTANDVIDLYAVWGEKTYTVTYDGKGATGGSTESQTGVYNSTINLRANGFTKTGYTFKGWSTDSAATTVNYAAGASYTITGNATLYAVWEINTYTVTYDLNGGTSGGSDPQTKTYGEDLTLVSNTPTRTGYKFLGWSTDPNAKTADSNYDNGKTYSENADLNLYAVWEKLYTLTLKNGTKTTNSKTVWGPNYIPVEGVSDLNSLQSYTAPQISGWTLDGWYARNDGAPTSGNPDSGITNCTKVVNADGTLIDGASGTGFVVEDGKIKLTQNVTLYACWTKKGHNATIYVLTDSFKDGEEYIIASGTSGSVKAIYQTNNSGTVSVGDQTVVTTGEYSSSPYIVTDNKAYVWKTEFFQDYTGNQGKVYHGFYLINSGYTNNTWYLNNTCIGSGDSSNRKGYVYDAVSKLNDPTGSTGDWSYECRMWEYNDGFVPCYGCNAGCWTQKTYLSGENIYTTTANTASEVETSIPSGASQFYIYQKEESIEENQYSFDMNVVSFDANGNGNTPSAQYVADGLTAKNPGSPTGANFDFIFGGWYYDRECTNAFDFSTSVTGDITLYAKWTTTVTFNSNNAGHVTTPSSQTVRYGQKVTKPADQTYNNQVLHWYKESACTNEWNFDTDTVTSALTLYAKWTQPTYYIAFDANGGTGTMSNMTLKYGTSYNLTANQYSREGYGFAGWNTKADGTGTSYSDKANVTNLTSTDGATITLYAQWGTPYKINYVLDGGTNSANNPEYYTYGVGITSFEDATKSGYAFAGWYDAAENGNEITGISTTQSGEVTLYAHWTTGTTIYILKQIDTPTTGENYLIRRGNNTSYYLTYNSSVQWSQNSFSTCSYTDLDGNTVTNVMYVNSPTSTSLTQYEWKVNASGSTYTIQSQNKSSDNYLIKGNEYGMRNKYYGIRLGEQANALTFKYSNYKLSSETYGVLYRTDMNSAYLKSGETSTTYFYQITAILVKDVTYNSNSAYSIMLTPSDMEESLTSEASNSVEFVWDYTLTLKNGSAEYLTAQPVDGTAELSGYTTPTRVDESWALDGWYTANDGTGIKVLNADGSIAEPDLAGYTSEGAYALAGDATLYACWTRLTTAYVLTEGAPEKGQVYLYTVKIDEEEPVYQLAIGTLPNDAGTYNEYVCAVDPEDGDCEYSLYDAETGLTSPITQMFITGVSQDVEWYCKKDKLITKAEYLKKTGEESQNPITPETYLEQAKVTNYGTCLYKRVTVMQTSFADETVTLTLRQNGIGTTYSVSMSKGLWTDWDGIVPAMDGYKFLGWFDSEKADAVQVLGENGEFAAQYVEGYVVNYRWTGGSNVILYAKWETTEEYSDEASASFEEAEEE